MAKQKKKRERKVTLIQRGGNGEAARQVYRIMDELIGKYHGHLAEAKIALAWKYGWKENADGRRTLGQCRKGTDLDYTMHGYDFVILLNFSAVNNRDFNESKLTALIDHELCHAAVVIDEDTGEVKEYNDGRPIYRIRKHDLEEFKCIVDRHGFWKTDLQDFGHHIVQRAKQDGLFDSVATEGSKVPQDSLADDAVGAVESGDYKFPPPKGAGTVTIEVTHADGSKGKKVVLNKHGVVKHG